MDRIHDINLGIEIESCVPKKFSGIEVKYFEHTVDPTIKCPENGGVYVPIEFVFDGYIKLSKLKYVREYIEKVQEITRYIRR